MKLTPRPRRAPRVIRASLREEKQANRQHRIPMHQVDHLVNDNTAKEAYSPGDLAFSGGSTWASEDDGTVAERVVTAEDDLGLEAVTFTSMIEMDDKDDGRNVCDNRI